LCGQQKAEHVRVEHFVKQFLGDGLDLSVPVDAGVIDEDVDSAIVLAECE
jgi:hypothetical protein